MSDTNVRYDCHFCKKDFLQKAYLKHLFDNHLNELFIHSSEKKTSLQKSNYNRLKKIVNGEVNIQESPFTLDIPNSNDVVYICMKEVVAIHKLGSYKRKHGCCKDMTHIQDNLNGLKQLWNRIQSVANPDKEVRIVEKIVEVPKIVEKIVYRDGAGCNRETLTEMLLSFNKHFNERLVSDKLAEKSVTDLAESQRQLKVKDSIIKQLKVLCITGATYNADKMADYMEEADKRINIDETSIRNNMSLFRETVRNNIDTLPIWEESAEELKELGVYDDIRDYVS